MAGEALRPHDPQTTGPPMTPGYTFVGQRGGRGEVLTRAAGLPPAAAQPSASSGPPIAGTCHSQRGIALRQADAPWRWVVGRGEGASPPLGNPRSSCSPTQTGSGAEATPYAASFRELPSGAPPGPGEGVRSASEKKPAHRRNPPPGWASLETEAPVHCCKSAQLSTVLLQWVLGCGGPAGLPLTSMELRSGVSQGSLG